MPTEIIAVKCAQCGMLHEANDRYIHLKKVEIVEHRQVKSERGLEIKYDSSPQSKNAEDVIVCSNGCLSVYLELRGY